MLSVPVLAGQLAAVKVRFTRVSHHCCHPMPPAPKLGASFSSCLKLDLKRINYLCKTNKHGKALARP